MIPVQGTERQRGAGENQYVLFDAPSLPSILRRRCERRVRWKGGREGGGRERGRQLVNVAISQPLVIAGNSILGKMVSVSTRCYNHTSYRTPASCGDLLVLFLRHTPGYPEGGGKILAEPNSDQRGEDDPKAGNKVQRFMPARHLDTKARSPIGADVEKEEILGGVVTDVAKTAEIFLSDIEDGLGERHEVCRKAKKRSDGGIEDICGIQVKSVDNEFHDVEGG